jgi:hypothetical protein
VTPLTWSVADATTNENFDYSLRDIGATKHHDIQWARRFYGRVYMNEGGMAELLLRAGMPTSIADDVLGSGVPQRMRRNAPLHAGRLLRSLPRLIATSAERSRNEAAYRAFQADVERWVDDCLTREYREATDGELWDELARVWLVRFKRGINFHADATSEAMGILAILNVLVKRCGGGEHLARDLASGVDGVRSAEMAPALWAIASKLREVGIADIVLDNEPRSALMYLRTEAAAVPAMALFGQFLREHGHRAAIEGELRYPRWAEQPEQVIGMLKGYLEGQGVVDPGVAEAATRRQLEERTGAFEARLGPVRSQLFRMLVRRTRELVRLRDNGQHHLVKLCLPIRRICAEFGRRWENRGWLRDSEDVFFLDLRELAAIASAGTPEALERDLDTVVSDRRKAYDFWFTVSAPDVIDSAGRPVAPDLEVGE